jgi:hypothetical protein
MKLEDQRWDGRRCVPWTQPVAPPKVQIPEQTAAPPVRVATFPPPVYWPRITRTLTGYADLKARL